MSIAASLVKGGRIAGTAVLAFLVFSVQADELPLKGDQPLFNVGDSWRWERSDRLTGLKESETVRKITSVSSGQIEGTENDSRFLMTPDYQVIEASTYLASEPARYYEFPLEPGKKWKLKQTFTVKSSGAKISWRGDAEVVGRERLKVPAGEFDSFKIEFSGWFDWALDGRSGTGKIQQTYWYAPAAKSVIRSEYDDGRNKNITQLVSFQLQQ